MSDGSLSSQVEDWIIATISGHADIPAAGLCEAFIGVENYGPGSIEQAVIDDLRSKPGQLWCAARAWRHQYLHQAEDFHDCRTHYIIYTAVQNPVPGASRRGDDGGARAWIGINRYREILWELFDRDTSRPGKNSVGDLFTTDDVRIVEQRHADYLPKDFALLITIIEVRESRIVT